MSYAGSTEPFAVANFVEYFFQITHLTINVSANSVPVNSLCCSNITPVTIT